MPGQTGHCQSRTWVSLSCTGRHAAEAHGRVLKADLGWRGPAPARGSDWHGHCSGSALLCTHKNFRLRLWAGQRINNHNAESTDLLGRVLTSFERCQLPLILNQPGLGTGGERSVRGQGGPLVFHSTVANWVPSPLRVERQSIQNYLEIISWPVNEQ